MVDNYKKNRKIINLIFNPKKPNHVKALKIMANKCRNKGYTDYIINLIIKDGDILSGYREDINVPVSKTTSPSASVAIEKITTPSDDIGKTTNINTSQHQLKSKPISEQEGSNDDNWLFYFLDDLDASNK